MSSLASVDGTEVISSGSKRAELRIRKYPPNAGALLRVENLASKIYFKISGNAKAKTFCFHFCTLFLHINMNWEILSLLYSTFQVEQLVEWFPPDLVWSNLEYHDQVVVTDVTVNDLTVTIREEPDGFAQRQH